MEKKIILTGICFWSTQAIFQRIKGVTSTLCGYYHLNNKIEKDKLESVIITYDENIITLNSILDIYFLTHNPSLISWNMEECIYPLCRPAIFFFDEQDEKIITDKMNFVQKNSIEHFHTKKLAGNLNCFQKAPDYDQNFYNKKIQDSFSCTNIKPKIDKIKISFPHFLKD